MEPKDVDICITTFNRNDRLKNTIEILSKQKNQNFNLIINDDGSKGIIDPNDYPIITKYIWNKDDKYNRVLRFNESILMCVSPHIIILDDDCVPENEEFIDRHIEALKIFHFSKGAVRFPSGMLADSWFSTANLGFRRDVVKKYGLFFPEYNGYYGYEDMDLDKEIKMGRLSVANNGRALVNTGDDKYANGDRSDHITGRNREIFNRRWIH